MLKINRFSILFLTLTRLCTGNEFLPVQQRHISPRACEDAQSNFGAVRNLNLDASTEDFLLTWEPPEHYEDCQLTYKIELNSAIFREGVATTSLTIPGFVLIKCDENEVVVTPVFDDVTGVPEIVKDIAVVEVGFWLLESLDLAQENGQLNATWTLSTGLSMCSISYEIQLNSEVIETINATAYVFGGQLDQCVDYQVRITPIILGIRGFDVSERYTLEPEFIGHPNNGWIELNDNDTFTAYWDVPDDLCFCLLTYEMVLSAGGLEVLRDWVTTTCWTSTRPFSYYCTGFELEVLVTGNYNNLPNRGTIFSRTCNMLDS